MAEPYLQLESSELQTLNQKRSTALEHLKQEASHYMDVASGHQVGKHYHHNGNVGTKVCLQSAQGPINSTIRSTNDDSEFEHAEHAQAEN